MIQVIKKQLEEKVRKAKTRERFNLLIFVLFVCMACGLNSLLTYPLHNSLVSSFLIIAVPFVLVVPIRFVLYLSEVKRIRLTVEFIKERNHV